MHIMKTANISAAALLICCLAAVASPARAADWEWTLVPYVWASDISVDVTVQNEPVFGADISFDDLVDNIDYGFQLYFEGRRGKGGFFTDLTFIKLGQTQTTVARPPLPGGTEVMSDVKTTLIEAGGFYRPSGGTDGLDLLVGIRVIDFELDLGITSPPPAALSTQVTLSANLTDAFAGIRYKAPLNERWSFVLRGDVGAGDSDRAWNALALLGYQVGKKKQKTILFGYRYLKLEFKESGSGLTVETDMVMSGPIVGFVSRF